MAKMKDRNHDYLYTVVVRVESTSLDGKSMTHWRRCQVEAFNIWQAAGKLKLAEDDIRYEQKEIL